MISEVSHDLIMSGSVVTSEYLHLQLCIPLLKFLLFLFYVKLFNYNFYESKDQIFLMKISHLS